MNTMLSSNYTHVGAGISQHGGMYYYALDAAAATGSGQMPSQASVILTSIPEGSNVTGASQYIIPVELNTAQPNGDVIHVVEYGQSLWAIAIKYDTKIKELQALNNLGDSVIVQQGQKLLVKRGATQPALELATPLPPATVTFTPMDESTLAAPPTPFLTALVTTPTTTPVESVPASNPASSKLLIGILIIAAFVGGGVAVWLIRDPN
jgi:LysM repeat protein